MLAPRRAASATGVVPTTVGARTGGEGEKSVTDQHPRPTASDPALESLASSFWSIQLERTAAGSQARSPEAKCSSTASDRRSSPSLAEIGAKDPVQPGSEHPSADAANSPKKRSPAEASGRAGDPTAADQGGSLPIPHVSYLLRPSPEQGVPVPVSWVPGAHRGGDTACQAAVTFAISVAERISQQAVATEAEVQLKG